MEEKRDNERQSGIDLTSLSDTVKTEGWRWIVRRLRYRTPHTAFGRTVHMILRRLIRTMFWPFRQVRGSRTTHVHLHDDCLYAFYDLQVTPVTFDASWFAASADLLRRQLQLSHIYFVVVPGNHEGFREERTQYEESVDTTTRQWRLHNIVLPILTMVPSCIG